MPILGVGLKGQQAAEGSASTAMTVVQEGKALQVHFKLCSHQNIPLTKLNMAEPRIEGQENTVYAVWDLSKSQGKVQHQLIRDVHFSHGSGSEVVSSFWMITYYKKDEVEIEKTNKND